MAVGGQSSARATGATRACRINQVEQGFRDGDRFFFDEKRATCRCSTLCRLLPCQGGGRHGNAATAATPDQPVARSQDVMSLLSEDTSMALKSSRSSVHVPSRSRPNRTLWQTATWRGCVSGRPGSSAHAPEAQQQHREMNPAAGDAPDGRVPSARFRRHRVARGSGRPRPGQQQRFAVPDAGNGSTRSSVRATAKITASTRWRQRPAPVRPVRHGPGQVMTRGLAYHSWSASPPRRASTPSTSSSSSSSSRRRRRRERRRRRRRPPRRRHRRWMPTRRRAVRGIGVLGQSTTVEMTLCAVESSSKRPLSRGVMS